MPAPQRTLRRPEGRVVYDPRFESWLEARGYETVLRAHDFDSEGRFEEVHVEVKVLQPLQCRDQREDEEDDEDQHWRQAPHRADRQPPGGW